MTRNTSIGLLIMIFMMLWRAAPTDAQQVPVPVTQTRQAFRALELGMTREQVSKLVTSQGPMDLKQESWGRWVPGTKPGEIEVLRVHFFDNRVYWVEYDGFGDSWIREEKGGCSNWVGVPYKRLQDTLKIK